MDLIDGPELAGWDCESRRWVAGACGQGSGLTVGFEFRML
jgi:hypothetical protein